MVASAQKPTAPQNDKKPETHITKEQADELFRSVDTLTDFAAKDTGLPNTHTIKRTLVTREAVTKYLRAKFDEDESARRMERSEIVLKKLGMLDHDFDLRPFLISLLTEQIAGYYDNKTKTVNLLDWIEPDEQKPVLAHELTHALQDQKVDLTKWNETSLTKVSKDAKDDNQHIQLDEADTAREAVLEGQAMIVFVDYMMKDSGKTLADVPEEAAAQMQQAITNNDSSPILTRAPLLLQRSLVFPYSDGLVFEQALLHRKGKSVAFGSTLENPPSTSAQIIHPTDYLANKAEPVLHLPDIHPLLDKDYVPYDVGVMGELDVRMLAELFNGPQMAQALAPEWAGGIYYAAQKKGVQPGKMTTGSLGLIYYSRWKNRDSARSFEHLYSGHLPIKYSNFKRRESDEKEGEEIYSTNEGDVLLWTNGSGVFIAEGFDLDLARKLQQLITAGQGEGPMSIAGSTSPSLNLSTIMSSYGIPRAALAVGRYTQHLR